MMGVPLGMTAIVRVRSFSSPPYHTQFLAHALQADFHHFTIIAVPDQVDLPVLLGGLVFDLPGDLDLIRVGIRGRTHQNILRIVGWSPHVSRHYPDLEASLGSSPGFGIFPHPRPALRQALLKIVLEDDLLRAKRPEGE
jgi:hypothetical protein